MSRPPATDNRRPSARPLEGEKVREMWLELRDLRGMFPALCGTAAHISGAPAAHALGYVSWSARLRWPLRSRLH